MASLYQLSSVGRERSYPRKRMSNLRLYEAVGPARVAWLALSGTITKYANAHDEEITRGIKKPVGHSIDFFMAGSKPATARPTIIISSTNKAERKAAKRVIESLGVLAEYPDIAVECVHGSVAMLHADGDLPYDVPRNPAHELLFERGITLCGARIVAGNSVATLGGAIYLDDGKTIIPFGLTVFHAGSSMEEPYEEQPEDEMAEFAFDESSDEEEDEDLFENRSRSLSTSQTDTGTDESTRSQTIASVDLEPEQVAEDFPQESILSPPDTTDGDKQTSNGRPPNGLDYQLVSLSGMVCPENMLQIPSQAPIQPKFVAKEAKDVGVWAATSTTPPVRGRLSICPYLLKLPTYSLQKLWVVDLERDIRLGDSGAWVMDESSNVYGHIVAATPGSFRAYILPLHQIFEDIEVFTKCKPSLLSLTERGSKALGAIPMHVKAIPYGSGQGEPSGNESDKTEELPTRNLQNEAQKRWGINIPDNPIEPLNTTELANVDKPAPVGENTLQSTNPKATTEKEKQKTQDKSENTDKIETRGRQLPTVITITRSPSGTYSDSDSSASWDPIYPEDISRDSETEAKTVSGNTATANKKVNERPTNVRTRRPPHRSPSRERRSVAFDDDPSYYGSDRRTRPDSDTPSFMRPKPQEPSRTFGNNPSGPLGQPQYAPYGYPTPPSSSQMHPPQVMYYGHHAPPGCVHPIQYGNIPFAQQTPVYNQFIPTASDSYPPVNQTPFPGATPAPEMHHPRNLAGSRAPTDNHQYSSYSYVPQNQQAPEMPIPPRMPGYPQDAFYSMSRAFADSLFASTRQSPDQSAGQSLAPGVKDRDTDDARRNLDIARRDLNDAWRDLDDARRDLDLPRNSYDRDRLDRYSRMDEDEIFVGYGRDPPRAQEVVNREETRRLEMEAHREEARRLETEIRLEQEQLRDLESRNRAPTESSRPGNHDKRISDLERDLQNERQKIALLKLEAKRADLRQVERDLKHAKELEGLKSEVKRLSEQQQASTIRPVDTTARQPPTDSYDFNSAKYSSHPSKPFSTMPWNIEEASDLMRKRERVINPDSSRRSFSPDRRDRNRIAATPYNREEDLENYIHRPNRRDTYEERDRSIPPRVYSRLENRFSASPTPTSFPERRRRESSYLSSKGAMDSALLSILLGSLNKLVPRGFGFG
ncbi:hypothetical protein V493_04854 [Pseudogymnoascus sp. VKM F-4281 (FW-2241)]|nr:hypothetical protein V493_04854 [Pseudogymnoascus sp. VKM F-4281 (FW-2241)]